jgi:hypothetical protein
MSIETTKFGRNYNVLINLPDIGEVLSIEPPFTIYFNVKRNNLASANTLELDIYNISPESRGKIFQDRFNPKQYKQIIFQAGYDKLYTLYQGNIFYSYSYGKGTEVITHIMARDGGFDISNAYSNVSVEKGTQVEDLIKLLAKDFKYINLGEIGETGGELKRGRVLSGSTFALINEETGNKFFIDNEKLLVLKDNEVVKGEVPLLSFETGLLGTPRREDSYLSVDLIFQPDLIIGQVVEIKSRIMPEYNGQYKVIGISHCGMISESVCSKVVTTVNLLIGSQLFNDINSKSGDKEVSNFKVVGKSSGTLSKPLTSYTITSKFGNRTDPFTGKNKFHSGIDLAAPAGTKVYSAKSGKVIFAGNNGGYGKCVIIQHDNGITTLYGHMSSISVSNNAVIQTGTIIGKVGSTGRSTGNHLHFEVRKNGKYTNPSDFIRF